MVVGGGGGESGNEATVFSLHILITSLHSKRCISELPLRVGLVCAMYSTAHEQLVGPHMSTRE